MTGSILICPSVLLRTQTSTRLPSLCQYLLGQVKWVGQKVNFADNQSQRTNNFNKLKSAVRNLKELLFHLKLPKPNVTRRDCHLYDFTSRGRHQCHTLVSRTLPDLFQQAPHRRTLSKKTKQNKTKCRLGCGDQSAAHHFLPLRTTTSCPFCPHSSSSSAGAFFFLLLLFSQLTVPSGRPD